MKSNEKYAVAQAADIQWNIKEEAKYILPLNGVSGYEFSIEKMKKKQSDTQKMYKEIKRKLAEEYKNCNY
jgi:uncharacterized short protein YbdD (DUF466 family)